MVLRAALKPLRGVIRLVDYLDDLLILGRSPQECAAHTTTLISWLEILGFTINREKSSLSPSQEVEYLGWRWSSKDGTQHLPVDKQQRISVEIRKMLNRTRWSLRETQRIQGLINWLLGALPEARIQLRPIQHLVQQHADLCISPLRRDIIPGAEARNAARWWLNQVATGRVVRNFLRVELSRPDIILETDASNTGWGVAWRRWMGHQSHSTMSGWWSREQLRHRIERQELQACVWGVVETIRRLKNPQNIHILLRTDNTIALSYLSRGAKGGRKPTLNRLAQQVWEILQRHKIRLTLQWIPTENNKIADALSRRRPDHQDYKVRKSLIRDVCRQWKLSYPTWDLFATPANTRCKLFNSRHPQPQAQFFNTLGTNIVEYLRRGP